MMKKWVLALMTAGFLLLPLSASAIELTDYIDPDIFYQDAELTALFNLKDGNQDQTSFNGSAELAYDLEYSTLPFKWMISADGNTDFARGPQKDDETADNYYMDAWTEAKKYLNNDDGFFAFGRMEYGLRELEENETEDNDRAEVTAGVGYGRVITATPLMEAIRVVEDLQKYGIIQGGISDDTYLRLADIIAQEQEYKSRYSLREYEKFWYEAMEEVLRQAGVLVNDTLGAMGVIRIQDILTEEKVLRRKHGWEVSAGVGYLISDYSGNDSDPILRASAEYAMPFGFQWQLIERISYSSILEDWDFGDTDHSLVNDLSLLYEITEMVDWINTWELNMIISSDNEGADTYRNALISEFRFYLTNTIDALARLRFDHLDQDDNDDDDVVTTFFLGLSYTIF